MTRQNSNDEHSIPGFTSPGHFQVWARSEITVLRSEMSDVYDEVEKVEKSLSESSKEQRQRLETLQEKVSGIERTMTELNARQLIALKIMSILGSGGVSLLVAVLVWLWTKK